MNNKCEVYPTGNPDMGYGVRAKAKQWLEKDEEVVEYTGEFIIVLRGACVSPVFLSFFCCFLFSTFYFSFFLVLVFLLRPCIFIFFFSRICPRDRAGRISLSCDSGAETRHAASA